jgi:RNase H-fold protein (predicted Holliday junction resolvase)
MNEAKLGFVEYDNTIDFFAKPRNNAKKKSAKQTPMEAQKMAKKRPIIETVIGIQKNVMDLEHTRHRKATNAFTHSLAAICGYSFYQRKPKVSISAPLELRPYCPPMAA